MRDTVGVVSLMCGLFCLYPLVFFAIPAYLIGKRGIPIRLSENWASARKKSRSQRDPARFDLSAD